jgi:hypothetical protein
MELMFENPAQHQTRARAHASTLPAGQPATTRVMNFTFYNHHLQVLFSLDN